MDRNERLRRYPPLVAIATLAIAAFGLPSVLNLPQANPSQVLEYAPVPPDEDIGVPPGGSFAGLGLGSSSTLGGASAAEGPSAPAFQPPGRTGRPSRFTCFIDSQGVARQTEDPLSPPCVPSFEGDNFGSTHRGVNREEIKVVFYFGCGGQNTFAPTSRGSENAPCGTADDIDAPPDDEEDFLNTRALKRYSAYFNSRYQTYDRHVHLYAYYSDNPVAAVGPGGCRTDCRKGNARTSIDTWNPFAVLTGGQSGFMDDYVNETARNDILNFGGTGVRRASFYRQYPGLIWSYAPSIDERADQFASFVCRQVVGKPVSFSGNGDLGDQRKFGILFSNDPAVPLYIDVKDAVKDRVSRCGGGEVLTTGYTDGGCSISCDPSQGPTHATELATFRQEGVTTILWIGEQNGEYSTQARNINYYPEWVVFGDGVMEDFVTGRYAQQDAWQHAWVHSNVTLVGTQDEQLCALALREVDPAFPGVDVTWACEFYDDLRQLFTGIQVAGPRLTPKTMDTGFHAIPAIASTSPQVPACFYRPGDYTCVKDAIAMWWDRDAPIRTWNGVGCYKVTQGGRRFLSDGWPDANITDLQDVANDPCNGYTSNSSFNPYQQAG